MGATRRLAMPGTTLGSKAIMGTFIKPPASMAGPEA